MYINFPCAPTPKTFKGRSRTKDSNPDGYFLRYLPDSIETLVKTLPVTLFESSIAYFLTSGPSGIIHL